MSKIKSGIRFLVKLLLRLLGILLIGIIATYFYLGSIVKGAITTFVPPITGTSASVEKVDLSLLSGNIEIRGLKIGNPKGYSTNNIFELGTVKVSFQPKSILTNKIVINSVLISGTKVSAELKNLYSTDNNITAIQQNIKKYTGTTTKKEVATTKTETKVKKSASKSVVIKDLRVQDTTLSVGIGGQTASLVLPPITQKDIGAKKSTSIADVIADILNLISLESVKGITASAKDLGKQGLKGAKDLLGKSVDKIKDGDPIGLTKFIVY